MTKRVRCLWCAPDAAAGDVGVCDLACAGALAVERGTPLPKEICRGSYSMAWVARVAGPRWSAGSQELRQRWAVVQRKIATAAAQ